MGLTPSDLQAIGLTLQVAALTTFILLILGVPLAWWLARSRSSWRKPVEALVAMPLLIPLVGVQMATPLVAFMALTTTLMVRASV